MVRVGAIFLVSFDFSAISMQWACFLLVAKGKSPTPMPSENILRPERLKGQETILTCIHSPRCCAWHTPDAQHLPSARCMSQYPLEAFRNGTALSPQLAADSEGTEGTGPHPLSLVLFPRERCINGLGHQGQQGKQKWLSTPPAVA